MRLWHIDLIPYLPKSQLVGQWRELNSIFKKQDKHILINYIYDYDPDHLNLYTLNVLKEMHHRGYRFNLDNYINHFISSFYEKDIWGSEEDIYYEITKGHVINACSKPFQEHHNKEYLTICYYNLKEKYIRGQKDFTKENWDAINKFYMEEIKNDSNKF